jgi:hypothetical protein
MDLGNIVYIVAVLAYFIYQATQNKKKKQAQQDSMDTPEPTQRPASFEDLLKEIRGEQSQKPTPELPKPIPEQATTSRNFESTYEKPKSDSSYHKPQSSYAPRESTYQKPVSSYEKPASTYGKPISTYGKPVSTYEKPVSIYDQRKAWKETVRPDDDEISYYEGTYEKKVHARASDLASIPDIPTLEIGRMNVKSKKTNPYAQLLRNPSSVRDVIVLTEILAKKNF